MKWGINLISASLAPVIFTEYSISKINRWALFQNSTLNNKKYGIDMALTPTRLLHTDWQNLLVILLFTI